MIKKIAFRVLVYFINIIIAFDILINAVIGGHQRETLSGRMGRAIERGDCIFCHFVCRHILHRLDQDHCKNTRNREKRFVR